MVNTAIPDDQQAIQSEVDAARKRVAALEERRREVDAEWERMASKRQQYALLSDICASLDQLHELGADHLFWTGQDVGEAPEARLAVVRQSISAFQEEAGAVERTRERFTHDIQREQDIVEQLQEELLHLQEQEERRKHEFVVEREYVEPPYRPVVMPWTNQGDDEWRFRKVMLATLLISIGTTFLMSFWTITPPPATDTVEIPERLARLVKKEPPKPVEPREEKKVEQKDEKLPQKETPTPAETQVARKKAESSGLLAFKNSFSDLMEISAQPKLGADARISNRGEKSTGQQAERSLITAQAQGGSQGINTASLSRNVGGTGKQGGGVQFARVESSIGADMGDTDRPLSKGPGPSRTDEEIQIVFDRYKAALYRIYNRELRIDPTLRGKMVLRITIEPNGAVSLCKVDSTDLGSQTLVKEIVERVSRFNFGPKEHVPKVTILYPIDFLPAT